MALALVWVEGGEDALNTNEAYAFASCDTCAAVSVAFQVVFVVGDNDVAAPQNLAAAVNYDCVNCLTYALAQQLFVTLDGPLTDEAMAQLDAIWAELAAFGEEITSIPLDEIQDRLDEFEEQILAVIEADQPGTVPVGATGIGVADRRHDQRSGGDDVVRAVDRRRALGESHVGVVDPDRDDQPLGVDLTDGGAVADRLLHRLTASGTRRPGDCRVASHHDFGHFATKTGGRNLACAHHPHSALGAPP